MLSSKLDLLMLSVIAKDGKDQRSEPTHTKHAYHFFSNALFGRVKHLEEERSAAQAEQSNALLDAVHSDALLFD